MVTRQLLEEAREAVDEARKNLDALTTERWKHDGEARSKCDEAYKALQPKRFGVDDWHREGAIILLKDALTLLGGV